MKLGNIAQVRSGLVLARKQARERTAYRYPLLNLKCIHPSGYIDTDLCEMFDSVECLNPEYLTHKGDVVVRLTIPYTAVLITDDLEGYVIPSSFVVIRSDRSMLLPEYLIWLLNSQKVKKQMYEGAVSNMLGAVKPRYFAEYEIDEIPISRQRIIADLNQLAKREVQLLEKLASEKEKYYDHVIAHVHNEMKRGN
jgi:restriction endonuclease S subunit